MDQTRYLFLLWLICLAFVAYALSIKLSENSKQKTYTLNTKSVIVTGQEIDNSFYLNDESVKKETQKIKTELPISAKAYLVGNLSSGEVYIQQNSNLVLPVASMSKLITAIESIDQFSLSHLVTIEESILNVPDNLIFNPGDKFTIEELLYPLLLNSSNIAAEALASSTNRIKFMELMSNYAWEIGMSKTYFTDPTGIDPYNISSANDFFALAKYLYNLRPDILLITRTKEITISTTTSHRSYTFNNIHPFISHPDFIGGKTGRTPQAKDTLLTIIKIKNKPIAIIVLSSDNRKNDTQYLIDQTQKLLK